MANKRSLLFSAITTSLFAIPLTIMLMAGIFSVVERARKDLELTAVQTGKLLGALVKSNANQLEVLASNRTVCDIDAPIETRLNAITAYADISRIRNIYITDRFGSGIGLDGSKRDFSRDRFFIQTARGSTGISYRLDDGPGTENFFAIAVPLYNRNAYSGSIVQFIPWDAVIATTATLNFGKTGYADIVERGTPQALNRQGAERRPNDGRARDDEEATSLRKRLASGEIGAGLIRAKGGEKIIGYAPIPGTNWSIGIIAQLSEVLDRTWVLVVFYCILIALMLAATERYYRRKLMLQEEKDDAIMRLQAAKEKLEAQGDIINAMAERRITESESQYHDLFETMSSGAILQEMILDEDGSPANFRYLSVNGMAERMFHIDRKNIVGKTFRDVNPDASDDVIVRMNAIAFGSEPIRLPDFETSDGLVIRNTAYSPKPGQFVTLFDDITEEVRAKEALEIEREKLIEATRAAEEANRAKGKFLANMSHEIRTPLNAIIGLADVEIETHKEPLTVRTFTAIRESAKNLMTLLNDILDYSKMEVGKLSLDKKPFALEEAVNNALVVTTPRLSGKRVTMLVDFDPTLPHVVMGDSVRLWQILKNLLDNAGKFTSEGQIILKVEKVAGPKLRITISDTGCGIEPGQITRLFGAFEQGNEEVNRKEGGTGLGLSITKQLVDMMGGTIEVSSERGIGTTFVVTLPLETPPNESYTATLPEEAAILAGKRVLVADDDPNARHIIKAILEKSGTEPVCLPTGEEAIACAARAEREGAGFDLFILDLILPGMSGIETANELRQTLQRKPRLVLVTAWSKNFSMDEIENAGFAETVDKPFVPSTVIRKLAKVLGSNPIDGGKSQAATRAQYPTARILAVEDNAQNRDVINRMLFLFGIRADFAENGIEALEKSRATRYDLIFMDIQMPTMNGLEATRLIRIREKEEGLPPTPIVAMTAYAMAEDIKGSLDVGMDAHITKPIELGMLRNTLEKYVGGKKASAEPIEPTSEHAKENADAIPQLDCVDVADGLSRLGNDKELFVRLLIGLRNMLERPQLEYESAISGDMINATARFIHTLKGITGNLGVTELFRITGELETDMKTHNPQRAKYEEYRRVCMEVFMELDRKLAKRRLQGVRKTPLESGTDDELRKTLDSLVVPLETGDAFAVEEVLETLKAKRFRRLGKKGIDELVKLASVFDYDTMLERISAIK